MFVLLKFSMLITILAVCYKVLDSVKSPIPLKFLNLIMKNVTENSLVFNFSNFCYRAKIRFTEWKYYKPATIVSTLIFGLSSGLRLYIIIHGFFPYSNLLLFACGLNGILRSIMSFGLVLTGSLIWKEILEQSSRHAPRIIPTISPNNFDSENNNNKDSKNNRNTNSENPEENKNKTKDSYWVRAGVIGSVVSGGVALFALFVSPYEKTIELQKEEIRIEKSRADFHKERADFHKERADFEKERADFEKTRADKFSGMQQTPSEAALHNKIDIKKQAEETAKKDVNDYINRYKK